MHDVTNARASNEFYMFHYILATQTFVLLVLQQIHLALMWKQLLTSHQWKLTVVSVSLEVFRVYFADQRQTCFVAVLR